MHLDLSFLKRLRWPHQAPIVKCQGDTRIFVDQSLISFQGVQRILYAGAPIGLKAEALAVLVVEDNIRAVPALVAGAVWVQKIGKATVEVEAAEAREGHRFHGVAHDPRQCVAHKAGQRDAQPAGDARSQVNPDPARFGRVVQRAGQSPDCQAFELRLVQSCSHEPQWKADCKAKWPAWKLIFLCHGYLQWDWNTIGSVSDRSNDDRGFPCDHDRMFILDRQTPICRPQRPSICVCYHPIRSGG